MVPHAAHTRFPRLTLYTLKTGEEALRSHSLQGQGTALRVSQLSSHISDTASTRHYASAS
jgi:hypothetical protein